MEYTRKKLTITLLLSVLFVSTQAQEIIPLQHKGDSWNGTVQGSGADKIVYNVTEPSLIIYRPEVRTHNPGTCVILAPGGGFHVIGIGGMEGELLAKELNQKGITAIILQYRLLHSFTENPFGEAMQKLVTDKTQYFHQQDSLIHFTALDVEMAVKYVREKAKSLNIDPMKVGVIGFSAGGAVALSAILGYENSIFPNFVGAIYPYINNQMLEANIPDTKIPLFISVAGDDSFGIANDCISVAKKWNLGGYPTELHLFQNGGHGLVKLDKDGSDTLKWLSPFLEWMNENGF